MTDQHLSVAVIASYVDDALDGEARATADRHLAVCETCRAELAELSDLVLDVPSARRSLNWGVIGGALAAAGLVGILVGSPERATSGPSTTGERAATRTSGVAV